ncbi:MAG TPA: hypothetical protein VLI92_04210 [Candidatus Saccharimonadales bacterium]|nr:hypothetical protein [Candidatus Saccharimonadales bacterium]
MLWYKVHHDDVNTAVFLGVLAPITFFWLIVTALLDRRWEILFVNACITALILVVFSSLGVTFDIWYMIGIWLICALAAFICGLISQSGNVYSSARQVETLPFVKEFVGGFSLCVWAIASAACYYEVLRLGYLGMLFLLGSR